MRIATRLPELRGKRSVAEIARVSGVPRSYVSQIERGLMLPRSDQVGPLEAAYGAPVRAWYDVWLARRDGSRILVTLELEEGEAA